MNPKNHLSGADGIRGFACAIVMAVHSLANVYSNSSTYLVGFAKAGVWLFFVLSAYLLTLRLQSGETIFDYALNRVLRIYPLFFLALLAHAYIHLWVPETAPSFWEVATFRGHLMHLWTIPVEMMFYVALPLMLPILVLIQRRLGDIALLIAIFALVGIQQLFFPYWRTPTDDSINLLWYLPAFLFGIAAALLRQRAAPRWIRAALVITILIGLVISIPGTREMMTGHRVIPPDLPDKHLFFGIAFALLIWSVVGKNDTATASLFENAVLRWAGRVSYPTYLFNLVVIVLLERQWSHPPLWAALIYFAATFIVGWIITIPEEPARRWLRLRIDRLYKSELNQNRL
jgi:peptidoglycan/LPS O-acetylase OafA/YrhL